MTCAKTETGTSPAKRGVLGSGGAVTTGSYLIIVPCRDEEAYLERMIETLAAQTVPPTLCVIVDDGSTDRTPEILEDAQKKHEFIKVVRREDRGRRKVGPGVIDTFYAGLETVNLDEFEFLCKLDADLELPKRYFETVIKEMREDPMLGNFSGKVYLRLPSGEEVYERMGDENAIGAAKFYRTECFEQIGGFVRQVSWDGIDGHMCRLNGWVARSENRPELRIIHRRLMGSSEVSVWRGRKRWGFGKYYMGSSLSYVLAVSAYRMMERPFIVGGLGILWGFLGAMLSGNERFEAPGFRKHLRAYERRSLIKGKRATAERFHAELREAKSGPGGG